ncbi:cryptochrome/photolyase family protein [Henriciella mobilis]|uniref:cryptochrome/photolyase family protein n=1 Tax=Henriciella mobilis TaxID=2305467 RepID=UPI001F174FFB|nr:deoxyribodipyrimidine photo-lyase [Henriciella mobilis]
MFLTRSLQEAALPKETQQPTLVWLRNDLRLTDHPAIAAAAERGGEVICVYIFEETDALRAKGGASLWWLDKSLRALRSDISSLGGKLICRKGDPEKIVPALVEETKATSVFWGRRYGKAEREIDGRIKQALQDNGIDARSFNTTLLTEPWQIETGSGGYYKVFTPYWKAVRESYEAPSTLPRPEKLGGMGVNGERIEDWALHPTQPYWSEGFATMWTPGEAGAAARLSDFLDHGVRQYEDMRNRPDCDGTSGLSPHLHFGELSPVQVWRAVKSRIDSGLQPESSAWSFLSEIVWREFSYVLLYFNPDMGWENYNPKFNAMPWKKDSASLTAWKKGQTGYPIVDAGMRQLWARGWMHNRVRMIVASFLTKHLLIHWRDGEDWFWDTLVDADPASNSSGWQWTAGSGADAAPYFRVFNPITQGQKFDVSGRYVREWCPELKDLPTKYLHAPWTADPETLKRAKVDLGTTYPKPIIDHAEGRERALTAWEALKEKQDAA